ncbi:Glu/Leu/Phe/Val dehydrogenase dimerization domain-containing protein [Actinomadura terrae]|uniref:Glu/Leu/Phe/Val dehydrogenase dimerization domain-containing protein n=1 Tax=Actinomadura terrae TaxID=604353 RepID=UPI001FA79815|nr:Glu/Leu/Phe/Val dehydrogenase dimerization domain-containing protein [Actinomadura terrae]
MTIVANLRDSNSGLEAYVIVDTLVEGKAMGGVRMTPDVTPTELAGLARQMTRKLALANLPIGGAKGGIVSDLPPGEERDRRLRAFGTHMAPLLKGGVYGGTDQGIGYRDRGLIFEAAGYEVAKSGDAAQLPCSWTELWERCSQITGYGIAESITAAGPLDAPASTVAVQGFGTVGRAAAVHLDARGHRVVAVSDQLGVISHPAGLPLAELVAATDPTGVVDRAALPPGLTTDADPDRLLDVPADILVLAACAHAVHESDVPRISARLIAEGANHPSTPAALAAFEARGTTVLPGIIANAGGAITTGVVLTGNGQAAKDADALAAVLHQEVRDRIRAAYAAVSDRAAADGLSLPQAAARVSTERVAARQEAVAVPTP